jgi:flagellin-like protein
MQIVKKKNKRKAISPVLATVILIAITLIAAIAVAGFVFGLFGSFTSTARIADVQAQLPDGIITAAGLAFQNTGTSNAMVNSITLTYGGVTCSPTITPTSIPATGAATPVPITALNGCAAGTSGQSFVGSAALSNGGSAAFSGIFP